MDTTRSALSTPDHPTNNDADREKSEVSSMASGGSPNGDVDVASEEKDKEEGPVVEDGGGGGGEEEVGEVDLSKWGPHNPVTLKIADLGNACWVVS